MEPGNAKPSINFADVPTLPNPRYWSHSVALNKASRLVFTSGITGEEADGSFPGAFLQQVERAFVNLEKALLAAGASPRDVIKITFYPVNWSLDEKATAMFTPYVAAMSEKYGWVNRPLTTTVPVSILGDPRALFEVEAVAALSGDGVPYTDGSAAIDRSPPPVEVDVVVVGGGFSGLQAAYDLQEAGIDSVLLEAKHRVGGRSRSQKLKSGPGIIELGATWLNKTAMPKIYDLTQKFGLECIPQWEAGDSVLETTDGTVYRLKDGAMENLGEDEKLGAYVTLMTKIEEANQLFEIEKPMESSPELDVSMEEWIKKSCGDNAFVRDIGVHLVSACLGREINEVGAHFMLDYLRASGGVAVIGGEGEHGAQSLKIRTGTSSIATGLANAMRAGSVRLNTPVERITQHEEFTLLETSTGAWYRARKVILAIPPNTYDYIHFSPPLPEMKRAVVSKTMGGIYSKVILTYSSAWWRDAGLSGKFTSFAGPICFSWEISDPNLSQYSLALFVSGATAKSWQTLNKLAKEESIVSHLAKLVGPQLAYLAKAPIEVNYLEWHLEEFIWGAPISSMGPGMLGQYAEALRAPFKHIHVAGGDTAYEWKGWLEGALRAGSRAAEEVKTALVAQAKVGVGKSLELAEPIASTSALPIPTSPALDSEQIAA